MYDTPDLMTFLSEKYLEELQGRLESDQEGRPLPEEPASLEPRFPEFVAWARTYLAEVNQPLNVAYLYTGLGLRMAGGETVALKPQPEEQERGMYDEGVHITRPSSNAGMGMLHTPTVPITGRR